MESKNNDSFLSLSSDEDNSQDEKETHSKVDIYHSLFKGITSEPFNPKRRLKKESNREKEKEEEEKNKKYILKLREKLNNNTGKIKDKKLLILPAPENDLTDNHYHTKNLLDEDDLNENKGFAKLMNPDNVNFKKNDELNLNKDNNNKNIISINQKDILDSNWEIKYINKILKKDMKEAIKKEEENQIEGKNNIKEGKKRKRDKKSNEDELEESNIKSKYSKISTKRKYGW